MPNGESVKTLAKAAKENGIWLVGGTIPEQCNDHLYNTCTVYSPRGDLISKYQKVNELIHYMIMQLVNSYFLLLDAFI